MTMNRAAPWSAVALSLLAALMSPASVGAATRIATAPEINSLAVTAKVIYVAAGRAGLFRSDDDGATWSRVASAPRKLAAVALDPRDPRTVWVSSDEATLVSRDGGATWSGDAKSMLALQFLDGGTLLGASLGGVFRSRSDGAFEHAAGADRAVAFDLAGGGRYALAVIGSLQNDKPERLWRTADGGRTWSDLRDVAIVDAMAIASDGRLMVVGMRQSRPEISDDGGRNWRVLPLEGETTAASIDDGRIVLAIYHDGETSIRTSDDRGKTWTELQRLRSVVRAIVPARGGLLLATSDRLFRVSDGSIRRLGHDITDALTTE